MGAGRLRGGVRRAAGEDTLARRGLRHPGAAVGAGDRHAAHERLLPGQAAGVAGHARVRERLAHLLDQGGRLLEEGDAHLARSGRDGHPEVHRGRLRVHVGRCAVPLRAQGDQLHRLAVQRHLQVVVLAQAPRAGQLHAHVVLGVARKQVLDVETAARAERQRLDAAVLRQILRRLVGVGRRRRRRAADGQTADGARRGEVALHQRLRHPQQAADVVEAEARIVGRQEIVRVDLHRQQVADGVAVLGAVQAVEGRRPARIAGGLPGPVELALEPGQERLELRFVRPRPAGRRHDPAAQLADHLLPPVRVAAHLGEIERVEGEADGAELPDQRRGDAAPAAHHPLVVAGDAVAVEQRAVGGAVVRPRRCRAHRRRADGLCRGPGDGLGRRLLRRRGNHPADRKRGHRQEQRHTGLRHEGAPHPLGSRTSHAIGWRQACQRLPDRVPFETEPRHEGVGRQVRRRMEALDRTVLPVDEDLPVPRHREPGRGLLRALIRDGPVIRSYRTWR